MAQRTQLGLTIIFAGLGLAAVGVLVAVGALSWFGRLPGDIRVERSGSRFYAPITSMILLSLGLSAAVALIRRLWR